LQSGKKKKFYKKLKDNKDYKLWLDAISKAGYSEVPTIWKQRVSEAIRKTNYTLNDRILIIWELFFHFSQFLSQPCYRNI
jgi:hypothetical protein